MVLLMEIYQEFVIQTYKKKKVWVYKQEIYKEDMQIV